MEIAGRLMDALKHLLVDLFVVVSCGMALLKVLAVEWRSLRKLLWTRRRECPSCRAGR